MLVALGDYIPEGVLPSEQDLETEHDISNYYPVYVTESVVLGEHMALFLDFQTLRPDIISGENKYNIHSLSGKEWAKRDAAILTTGNLQTIKYNKELEQDSDKLDHIYSSLNRVINQVFKDTIARKKQTNSMNTSEKFIKQNKDHPKIQEYKTMLLKGEYNKSTQIQNEILRENWRAFLASSRVNDLRQVFKFFAKTEGRTSIGYRPSCLDPLINEGKMIFKPKISRF